MAAAAPLQVQPEPELPGIDDQVRPGGGEGDAGLELGAVGGDADWQANRRREPPFEAVREAVGDVLDDEDRNRVVGGQLADDRGQGLRPARRGADADRGDPPGDACAPRSLLEPGARVTDDAGPAEEL